MTERTKFCIKYFIFALVTSTLCNLLFLEPYSALIAITLGGICCLFILPTRTK